MQGPSLDPIFVEPVALDVEGEPVQRAIWIEAAEEVARQQTVTAFSSNTALAQGHQLRRAQVLEPGHGSVTFCLLCGAYSWTQHGSLLKPCRGPVPGLKTQRDRIKAGRFPHSCRNWPLGPDTELSEEQVKELWRACGKPGVWPTQPQALKASRPNTALPDKRAVLQAFGILPEDEAGFLTWAATQRKNRTAARRRANRRGASSLEEEEEEDEGALFSGFLGFDEDD